jgi:hypothetical protein
MTPERIRVKLVSEAAEYVTVSHVVQRDFTLAELVELMLPVVGVDAGRIQRMIRIGTISTGEYRYRWDGIEVPPEDVSTVLEALPHPEPDRAFDPVRCFLARFRRNQEVLDLPREAAGRKPLFAKQSFWEGLLQLAAHARYLDYSHADKADVFSYSIQGEGRQFLRGLLPLLKPPSAADRLERLRPDTIEWLTRR